MTKPPPKCPWCKGSLITSKKAQQSGIHPVTYSCRSCGGMGCGKTFIRWRNGSLKLEKEFNEEMNEKYERPQKRQNQKEEHSELSGS